MTQNHMAAGLMIHFAACFFKGADGIVAGANRQAVHAGISTIY
jgi:hypothetical protein